MQSNSIENLPQLAEALQPLLRPLSREEDPAMEAAVTEGLVLPEPKLIVEGAAAPQSIPRLAEETLGWVRSVLRAECLPTGWEVRMVAIPCATSEKDAFAGAWQ